MASAFAECARQQNVPIAADMEYPKFICQGR